MIRGGIVGGLYGNQGGGGGNNPVSYYFGKGQTKRAGQNYTPGGNGNHRAAEFKTTADLVVDGTEKYYFLFPTGGGSNRSHFLRSETVN